MNNLMTTLAVAGAAAALGSLPSATPAEAYGVCAPGYRVVHYQSGPMCCRINAQPAYYRPAQNYRPVHYYKPVQYYRPVAVYPPAPVYQPVVVRETRTVTYYRVVGYQPVAPRRYYRRPCCS